MKPNGKRPTKRRHFATWVKTTNGSMEIRATHTNAKDAFKSGEALMNMGYKEVHVIDSSPSDSE